MNRILITADHCYPDTTDWDHDGDGSVVKEIDGYIVWAHAQSVTVHTTYDKAEQVHLMLARHFGAQEISIFMV